MNRPHTLLRPTLTQHHPRRPLPAAAQSRRIRMKDRDHTISTTSAGKPKARRAPPQLVMGLRPGYLNRRGLRGGSSGWISVHGSSSKIGLALFVPPCSRSRACCPPHCSSAQPHAGLLILKGALKGRDLGKMPEDECKQLQGELERLTHSK
ncbi:MAG: hypothetical protein JSR77_11450 [Planctomycetes bacterium]|nr:hypothetical protein [Planctomycetota bacterium]